MQTVITKIKFNKHCWNIPADFWFVVSLVSARVVVLLENQLGEIFCNTTSPSAWRKDGKILPETTRWYTNRIQILEVHLHDQGLYACAGHDENGNIRIEQIDVYVACTS